MGLSLGVAVLGALLAGCGEQQAPEAKGKLNVALIIPTTGELSSYGRQCRKGAELAREEINVARIAAGEVEVWLNIRDDHAETAAAEKTARQLYDVARFLAVVGPEATDSAVVVAGILQQHDVPVVVPTVEADGLRTGHENILQVSLTSSAIGRLLARFVTRDLRPAARRAVLVSDAGDTEAAALVGAFREAAGTGWAISAVEVKADPVDVAPAVRTVQAEQPGVVVAAVGAEEMGALIRGLRGAGETVPIVGGTHAVARSALAPMGLAMGEVYVAAHFAADENRRDVGDFVAAYQRANPGAVPGAAAALTYDAVKLVDAALRRAMPGTKDKKGRPTFPTPKAVAEALRNLTLTDAVTGPIKVDKDGNVTKPLFILKVDEAGARVYARVEP